MDKRDYVIISSKVNSFFNSVCYRIIDALIDPGDVWQGFNTVSHVLLTHAHFDHVYGVNDVVESNDNVSIYTNSIGFGMLLNARKNMSLYHETPFTLKYPDNVMVVENGDTIDIGSGMSAKAIFTPGHNPSCITWLIGGNLFTGDAYIPGVKTVTNLPGGNKEQAEESIRIIKELANGRRILPGHKI